jgi:hypothetical protein
MLNLTGIIITKESTKVTTDKQWMAVRSLICFVLLVSSATSIFAKSFTLLLN